MADECRPVEIDGEVFRVRGARPMDEQDKAAFAEIVKAVRARFADDRDAAAVPGGESNGLTYVVCDRLLDAETNEHCEFDGRVEVDARGYWMCPWCRARRYGSGAGGES